MKREFRPLVTPLEGRALMSGGLKGTLNAEEGYYFFGGHDLGAKTIRT